MCTGLHVKYRHSCQVLVKFEFSRLIFEKLSNIKFHDNTSSVAAEFRADRLTDMTKLTVVFRYFVNAPTHFKPIHPINKFYGVLIRAIAHYTEDYLVFEL
jgi:hypothetical protein